MRNEDIQGLLVYSKSVQEIPESAEFLGNIDTGGVCTTKLYHHKDMGYIHITLEKKQAAVPEDWKHNTMTRFMRRY